MCITEHVLFRNVIHSCVLQLYVHSMRVLAQNLRTWLYELPSGVYVAHTTREVLKAHKNKTQKYSSLRLRACA